MTTETQEFKRYTGVTNEGGGGGDYPIPQIDDGPWEAEVVAVGQGVYNSNVNGSLVPVAKYWIDWAFDDWYELDGDGNVTENRIRLRDFVRIPAGLDQDPPYLDDRATISKRMRAMGFKVPCDVYPPDWIGKRAQVQVEHYTVNKEGPQKGMQRPTVADVYPLPARRSQQQAPANSDGLVDPESLPWDGDGENTTIPPTKAHQALLSALNTQLNGMMARLAFLQSNSVDVEDKTVLQAVLGLTDEEARALVKVLQKDGA